MIELRERQKRGGSGGLAFYSENFQAN